MRGDDVIWGIVHLGDGPAVNNIHCLTEQCVQTLIIQIIHLFMEHTMDDLTYRSYHPLPYPTKVGGAGRIKVPLYFSL